MIKFDIVNQFSRLVNTIVNTISYQSLWTFSDHPSTTLLVWRSLQYVLNSADMIKINVYTRAVCLYLLKWIDHLQQTNKLNIDLKSSSCFPYKILNVFRKYFSLFQKVQYQIYLRNGIILWMSKYVITYNRHDKIRFSYGHMFEYILGFSFFK